MNILFDNIIYSKEKQGGISNYWYQVTKDYEANTYATFYEEQNATQNIYRKEMNIKYLADHINLPGVLARIAPIRYNNQGREDFLYHSSFYRKVITQSRVCEVTTVHDFLHNKYSTPLKRTIHNKLKYASIKRAEGVICVSSNTINDLKKYCPLSAGQKLAMIYNGVNDDYRPLEKSGKTVSDFFKKYDINNKFVLFVGARSNYKNFNFVLDVLKNLHGYGLVVVGNNFTMSESKMIEKSLREKIVMASNISNKELNIFYNFAHALIYPSSYEGFGIPVIEAMKAGCPVIALNNSSIPEVSGGAAILFNNLHTSKFVQEISHLENKDYRLGIINAGAKNANKFSWAKCVKETREFYNDVYQSFN